MGTEETNYIVNVMREKKKNARKFQAAMAFFERIAVDRYVVGGRANECSAAPADRVHRSAYETLLPMCVGIVSDPEARQVVLDEVASVRRTLASCWDGGEEVDG